MIRSWKESKILVKKTWILTEIKDQNKSKMAAWE